MTDITNSELQKAKREALSDTDITNYFNGKINIMKYSDIKNMTDISQVLSKYKRCIILFEIEKLNNGHYTCLILCEPKGKDPYILFHDPYGLMPENELNYIPYSFAEMSDQERGYLYDLFKKAKRDNGVETHYNQFKLQKMGPGINTCGRHCIIRCEYMNIDEDEFAKKLRGFSPLNPDDIVTLATISAIP